MKLESKVNLILSNEDNETIKIETTFEEMINKSPDDFYENLDECSGSAGCFSESQNFCDCGSSYDDYEITGIEIIEEVTDEAN